MSRLRLNGRGLRAAFAAFVALCINLLPFVPARATTFDDVISVMQDIDHYAPGALPFDTTALIKYRDILVSCGSASSTDAVLQCVEAASSTDLAQENGVPFWFPKLIAVYFDIEHHDYWGLLADAGEVVACAGAEAMTGVDVCGVIKTLIEAGKEVYEGGKAVVDAVEDFFSDLGSALGDLGCDIASLWGGCDDSPPPPPTAGNTANAICAAHGGVKSMLSHSNAVDDLSVICNDTTACAVKPGQAPQCSTPESKAAAEKQKKAQNDLDFATRPQQWAAEFEAKWIPQCLDDQCKVGIRFVKTGILALAKQRHAADPDYPWAFMGLDLMQADKQAQQIVNEAKQRQNDNAFTNGTKQWAAQFETNWLPQCLDDQCKTGIKFLRTGAVLHVQQSHQGNPGLLYSPNMADYVEADQKAAQIVKESQQRFNAKTTADAGSGWATLAVASWSKQCADSICIREVEVLGQQMVQAGNQLQAQQPDQSSLHIQGEIGKQFGPQFKAAVDRSIQRKTNRPFLQQGPVGRPPLEQGPPGRPPPQQQPGGRPPPITPG